MPANRSRTNGVRFGLLYQLALRDFRQRYVGSVLGGLWSVIHPLVLLAVYTFLFRFAFGARLPPDAATQSYPLFLLAGLLPWLLFSETLSRSAPSLPDHSALIKRSVFPSEAVPAAILVSTFLTHALSLVVLCVAVAVWGPPLGWTVALVPLWMVPLGLFSLGAAWIVAGLQVYLRDTAQVLSVVLTGWFWATPIFLPESFYRGRLDPLLDWNPLRYAVAGYRHAILGGEAPSLAEGAAMVAFATGAFVLGAVFFQRAKRGFADVL